MKKIIGMFKLFSITMNEESFNSIESRSRFILYIIMAIPLSILLCNIFGAIRVTDGYVENQNTFIFNFIIAILPLYTVVNAKVKKYDILPVSNKFIVRNIFLFNIINIILIEVAIWLASALGIIALVGISVIKNGKLNIEEGSGEVISQGFNLDYKGYAFMIAILVMAALVITALAFIRNAKIRILGIISTVAMVGGMGIITNKYIQATTNIAGATMLDSFSKLHNSNILLGLIVLLTVLSIPVCIRLCEELYGGKTITE